ncbi:phytanoyl-CoA dioxygenase family protein [Streptomyces sp. NPDC056987]|uniref:phytanoyl-CoA dioxygenase family protein n=1 Tax=Streptomyces sp. NPDC056987 TaxID=3345988 RepID=UPI0036359183
MSAHCPASRDIPRRTVESFRENGFAHVPRMLSAGEVDSFRTASLAALSAHSKSDDAGATRIISTEHVWRADGPLRELALHPRIGAFAERLAGMPLRVWRGDVLLKEPRRSARTNLHDDETFLPFEGRVSLTAWVALVDVTVERGCMTFLAGSHDRPGPDRVGLPALSADPDGYMLKYWPGLNWNTRVTVPLRAGDCTFHHGRTGHMAAANTTDEQRVSYVVALIDAEATYRPVSGVDVPGELTPGQRLPDDLYPRVGA